MGGKGDKGAKIFKTKRARRAVIKGETVFYARREMSSAASER
jgi:hypothetical protein